MPDDLFQMLKVHRFSSELVAELREVIPQLQEISEGKVSS